MVRLFASGAVLLIAVGTILMIIAAAAFLDGRPENVEPAQFILNAGIWFIVTGGVVFFASYLIDKAERGIDNLFGLQPDDDHKIHNSDYGIRTKLNDMKKKSERVGGSNE